jgi:glutathione S-transferase
LLAPKGPLARYRLLEMLAFISTEIHKSFKPFFRPDANDADRTQARELIGKRLAFLAERLKSDFLLGDRMSVADAYLFVMLLWAGRNEVTIPASLAAYKARLKTRPAVQLALEHEGLGQPAY